MVNQDVEYNPSVKFATKFLFEYLKELHYDVSVRLGDVWGPARSAMVVQVDFERAYMLCDVNSGKWKIAIFRTKDEEAVNGIVFHTDIEDALQFSNWFHDFIKMIY